VITNKDTNSNNTRINNLISNNEVLLDILYRVGQEQMNVELPDFNTGDTIKVYYTIREFRKTSYSIISRYSDPEKRFWG